MTPRPRNLQPTVPAMMLLSLHVISIGLLVLVVGSLGYRLGYNKAERHWKRKSAG